MTGLARKTAASDQWPADRGGARSRQYESARRREHSRSALPGVRGRPLLTAVSCHASKYTRSALDVNAKMIDGRRLGAGQNFKDIDSLTLSRNNVCTRHTFVSGGAWNSAPTARLHISLGRRRRWHRPGVWTFLRAWRVVSNPKEVAPQSPGLPVGRATLGMGQNFSSTPTGLWQNGPMPQSLSAVYVHLVFSTRDRRPFLSDPTIRNALHIQLAPAQA